MIQQITTYFSEHGAEWVQMVIDHLAISGMALAAALAIAVPLGILCSRHAWSERLATGTAGVLRVIPSLAILIICVPYLGVGTVPAVVALTVYFSEHGAEWVQMVIDHLAISGMALAAALAIAVPLGILCSRHAWSERLATGTAGVLRVIPSLAILIICVPYLGVGTVPAVVALTVLAIPPILINTAVALRSVPADVIEAGVGMGMSPARLWLTVKAPLAFPLAFSGVRTAASEIIASAVSGSPSRRRSPSRLPSPASAPPLPKSSHPQHLQRISGRAAWVSSSIPGSERSVTTCSGSVASPSPRSR